MTPAPTIESANAPHKSTGPTTQAGKDRSRLNALRHGLAGKTVVMPWEDHAAYDAHLSTYMEALAPFGEIETPLAQGIADDEWRLSRARAVDTNMFALGQFDYPAATGDAEMDSALNTARAFRDHSKAFVNLSLYEQRIQRSLDKNLVQLRALQAERRAEESTAAKHDQKPGLIPTKARAKSMVSGQTGDEFVCSTAAPAPSDITSSLHDAPPPDEKLVLCAA